MSVVVFIRKAADVGADLVGKVKLVFLKMTLATPAVIADSVGDNVGDVAGMGADLYESYAGSILATAALGVAAVAAKDYTNVELQLKYLSAPMILAGLGAVLSIIGIYLVRTKEGCNDEATNECLESWLTLAQLPFQWLLH